MGLIQEAEKFFQCCGYDEQDQQSLNKTEIDFCTTHISKCSLEPTTTAGTPTAAPANITPGGKRRKRSLFSPDCQPCKELLDEKIDRGFNAAGGLGLFFALTEVCSHFSITIVDHFLVSKKFNMIEVSTRLIAKCFYIFRHHTIMLQ